MCGNGARCFARFVTMKGLINRKQIKVSTLGGKIVLNVTDDDQVMVDMGKPVFEPSKIPFKAQGINKTYLLPVKDTHIFCGAVSMGNPHCVIKVDDVDKADVLGLGPLIENHERFPERVNVGFMQVLNEHEIKLRVFERGCGETLACGTGACTATVVGIIQEHLVSPVVVHLKGGDLRVAWQGDDKPVMMTGPAVFVYEGVIDI